MRRMLKYCILWEKCRKSESHKSTCRLPFPMSCFTVIPILKILLKSYATAPFTIHFMH